MGNVIVKGRGSFPDDFYRKGNYKGAELFPGRLLQERSFLRGGAYSRTTVTGKVIIKGRGLFPEDHYRKGNYKGALLIPGRLLQER